MKAMKKCAYCGFMMQDNDLYCPACGQRFRHISTQSDYEYIHQYMANATEIEYDRYHLELLQSQLSTLLEQAKYRYQQLTAQRMHLSQQNDSLRRQRAQVTTAFDYGAWMAGAFIWAIVFFVIFVGLSLVNIEVLSTPVEWLAGRFGTVRTILILLVGVPLILSLIHQRHVRQRKDEAAKAGYNDKIADNNQQIDEIDRHMRDYTDMTVPYYSGELSRCQRFISEFMSQRQRYYDADLLYKKYQALVPVVTMYAYLDERLCTHLEGEGGAYSKYDMELLRRHIVGRLEDIASHLDELTDEQRMIYGHMHSLEGQTRVLVQSVNKTRDTHQAHQLQLTNNLSSAETDQSLSRFYNDLFTKIQGYNTWVKLERAEHQLY